MALLLTDSTVSWGFGENVIPFPSVEHFPGRFSTSNRDFWGLRAGGSSTVKKNEKNRSISNTLTCILSNLYFTSQNTKDLAHF